MILELLHNCRAVKKYPSALAAYGIIAKQEGPSIQCTLRHRVPFDTINEDCKCVGGRGGQWAWQILLMTSQGAI